MGTNYRGAKFYKYDENEKMEVIRFLDKKTDTSCFVMDNDDLSTKRVISAEELSEYTLLKPNAMISVNIVALHPTEKKWKDVIVMVGKYGDKSDYACCRQVFMDPFMQQLGQTKFGVALSRPECPPGLDYDKVKSHNGVFVSRSVNIYRDDTKETIMALLGSIEKQASKVLSECEQRFKENTGASKDLGSLLSDNNFWGILENMFEITRLDDVIENNALNLEQLTFLEQKISHIMDDVTVVPYGYDINLGAIRSDYMLIRDSKNSLYLVSYLKGTFITQEHMSEEELSKFTSIKK